MTTDTSPRTHPAPHRRPGGDDRGSISLELAILAPVLLGLIAFAVYCGRLVIAENAVQEAARAAARSASIAPTAADAQSSAQATAAATLGQQNLHCTSTTIDVDTSGFAVQVGQPASVVVTISCVVQMDDLVVPGLPGSRTVTAEFTSPIDSYRIRG